ncbi:hypothetical protein TNCV_3053511 [Trichonephila clavipes]|uniref:Uncharacterized protein n=1 Tax=Trichonephila clavipes TaxID=2585209 RepID=A0A8X6RVR4_TRICX|nr:hypothetical protein TNCV_3053511 [Trichonephila clavipes]
MAHDSRVRLQQMLPQKQHYCCFADCLKIKAGNNNHIYEFVEQLNQKSQPLKNFQISCLNCGDRWCRHLSSLREFHRANSDCHLYGAQGQRQAYI